MSKIKCRNCSPDCKTLKLFKNYIFFIALGLIIIIISIISFRLFFILFNVADGFFVYNLIFN